MSGLCYTVTTDVGGRAGADWRTDMQNRELRNGFTTGTCSAAAARAAAMWLLTGEGLAKTRVMTPAGTEAVFDVKQLQKCGTYWFGVQKDAGDDPDVTHGTWVYAAVSYIEKTDRQKQDGRSGWYQSDTYPFLFLTGGQGIGIVTRPGLSCPVGKHAINPVPRQMIFEAVGQVCEEMERREELLIEIMIPAGAELAEKTFNPKLGIEGGISVLGTSGIVKPMSEEALAASIGLEIHMAAVAGNERLILTPGNYGETFLKETLGLSLERAVLCSNFAADAIEAAERENIRRVLFVGHLGKLIKIAGGVRNTHSRYGDRRMEILADCMNGVAPESERIFHQVQTSNTTEEAVEYLAEAGHLEPVMAEVVSRIQGHMEEWAHGKVCVEVVTFSTVYGILGKSQGADDLIQQLAMEDI